MCESTTSSKYPLPCSFNGTSMLRANMNSTKKKTHTHTMTTETLGKASTKWRRPMVTFCACSKLRPPAGGHSSSSSSSAQHNYSPAPAQMAHTKWLTKLNSSLTSSGVSVLMLEFALAWVEITAAKGERERASGSHTIPSHTQSHQQFRSSSTMRLDVRTKPVKAGGGGKISIFLCVAAN